MPATSVAHCLWSRSAVACGASSPCFQLHFCCSSAVSHVSVVCFQAKSWPWCQLYLLLSRCLTSQGCRNACSECKTTLPAVLPKLCCLSLHAVQNTCQGRRGCMLDDKQLCIDVDPEYIQVALSCQLMACIHAHMETKERKKPYMA